MSGYTRQSASEIIATNVVKAAPVNAEYNKLRDAFAFDSAGTTGHKHDGSSDEGSYVPLIADVDGLNKVSVDTSNNRVGVFVEVSSSAVEQVRFQDGAILPVTDNDIDLGAVGAEFKDIYIDGVAYIDDIRGPLTGDVTGNITSTGTSTFTTVDINGGAIDATTIGASTAAAITGTTITASTGFVGGLTGNVTGDLTGNVTGNITGDVTGDLTGNVTGNLTGNVTGDVTGNLTGNVTGNLIGNVTGNITSSGSSTFSGTLTVPTPISSTDAATKAYVDSQLGITISDFAITESGTDLNFSYSGGNVATLTSAGDFSVSSITLGGSDIQTLIDGAKPSFQATASGALSDGSMVIVNTDGTVSVAPAISSVVFESATSSYISATYDTTNNKVVIAYRDNFNSNYGTAVVGTVTGTSISFGTPVVFASAATQSISACFDSSNGKVVISYSDGTDGYAIVGTVSGTSISFGTAVLFDNTVLETNITYDTSNSKVVVFYPTGGSSYGIVGTVSGTSISFGTAGLYAATTTTKIRSVYDTTNAKIVTAYVQTSDIDGYAVIGTVSGTSISFGTPVKFRTGTLSVTEGLSIAYDSVNSKPVIFYSDDSTGKGYGIVGTVSGTSISFGTAVEFNNSNTGYISSSYNPQSGKVVVSYRDTGNSNYGTVIEGTVSGTSISFESELVIESSLSSYFSSVYDPDNESVVVAYSISGQGKALSYPKFLITENNFVGISSGAYTDGQTAKIQIVGSVDDAQSSLTAGNKYYFQTDGTLDTVADIPEIYVGLAIASDKIIVKG